jgi:hypothetical protein
VSSILGIGAFDEMLTYIFIKKSLLLTLDPLVRKVKGRIAFSNSFSRVFIRCVLLKVLV